jgi:polyvinyl alcohol dehydrogenase (cytochrome)
MRTVFVLFLVSVSLRAADDAPGARLYQAHCAHCHDAASGTRMPAKSVLNKMAPETILKALTTGAMKQQGMELSESDRSTLANWLGNATPAPAPVSQLSNHCSSETMPGSRSGNWTSWGAGPSNARFQTAAEAGLPASAVPNLKLKWAFGVPNVNVMRSQPAVYKGRIYLAADNGTVYSLDAATGCTYWSTTVKQIRSGIAVGSAGSVTAVFFGDVSGSVTALDANSGNVLWQTRVGDHPQALITGTPAWAGGRLYVPVSSYEELAAVFPGHQCCTFRGSVVALDAQNGKTLWRTHTIAEEATPRRKSTDGHDVLGPSGAAVWASPTVDAAKKRLYVTTGDNYSDPPTATSDALLALDLKSGKIIWSKQFTVGDTFNMSCGPAGKGNCPQSPGKDLDFGSSPVLVSLPSGKRALLLAQKSGFLHAVDPDAEGRLLWQARVGEGGALGGIQWGPAADGSSVYAALSDLRFGKSDTPGKLVLDPTKGGGIFAFRLDNGERQWAAPAPGCGGRRPCSPGQSGAVTAIPGVVFSGSLDGHLRAYDTKTGSIVWDFDTVRDFETVDHVPAKGGSLDVGGPVVAGGTLFVSSGYPQYGGIPGNVLLAFSQN